jgi:hypothetical protein
MAIPGWSRTESPYHAGKIAIQTRVGADGQVTTKPISNSKFKDYPPVAKAQG